ncbi:unnamed protein product [Prunus brigantina]
MLGTALKMIITDQDATMAKAIVQYLPTTYHIFERALTHQRHKELTGDHIDHNEVPQTQLSTPMERKVMDNYMREML